MAIERFSKGTLSVTELSWCGDGFAEPDANEMWAELPDTLKRIAREEIRLGNEPWNILRNSELGIVLLAFCSPPITHRSAAADLRV